MGRNVSFPKIEKATKCTIRTAKAYSSVQNKLALWPERNFTDVVKEELKKDDQNMAPAKYLVMSAPTVDIKNIDTTNLKESDNIEVFQQMVHVSCFNMFKAANLEKVVILEHAPRFDTEDVDPTQLKNKLARFANNTFFQMWLNSPLKKNIILGHHRISGRENFHGAFRNPVTNKHDGVHYYGVNGLKIFTNSVLEILKDVIQSSQKSPKLHEDLGNHQSCPQALYQRRQAAMKYQTPIHIQNRFSVFNSNLGNQ